MLVLRHRLNSSLDRETDATRSETTKDLNDGVIGLGRIRVAVTDHKSYGKQNLAIEHVRV